MTSCKGRSSVFSSDILACVPTITMVRYNRVVQHPGKHPRARET